MSSLFGCFVGLCVVIGPAFGQDETSDLKKHSHPIVVAAPGDVTNPEAQATFKRIAGLLTSVLHLNLPHSAPAMPAKGLVSKSDIIRQFSWLVQVARPAFVVTPGPVRVDAKRLVMQDASLKPAMQKLVAGGFVPNYGVMATSKSANMSIADFGETVGFFLARLVEYTHTPSSKWTPYLHN